MPIAASMLSAAVISRLLPPRGPGLQALQWWLAVTAPATFVLWLIDRAARRVLPLAMLLRVSLLFPDRAPSRYAIARAAGSTTELERRVARARSAGIDDEPIAAARTLLALVAALSAHDGRTRGHAERVRVYTDMLAEELHLSADSRDRLRWSALMHDMGKLAVPARLLNKSGSPTEDEWQVLRRHPAEGARLCAPLLPWLGEWGRAIAEHHERYDGEGYPAGLSGHQISLAARVLAVADAYEVMTAPRAYRRRPLGAVAARRELLACAGTHFDPAVVRAFLNISLARLRLAMGPLSWLAQWPVLRHSPQLGPSAGWATASIGGAAALSIGVMAPLSRADSFVDEPVSTAVAAPMHAPEDLSRLPSAAPRPHPDAETAELPAGADLPHRGAGWTAAPPRPEPGPVREGIPAPSSPAGDGQGPVPSEGDADLRPVISLVAEVLTDPSASIAETVELVPGPVTAVAETMEVLPSVIAEPAEVAEVAEAALAPDPIPVLPAEPEAAETEIVDLFDPLGEAR